MSQRLTQQMATHSNKYKKSSNDLNKTIQYRMCGPSLHGGMQVIHHEV